MKHPEHYAYLTDYVRDNRFVRESLLERNWVKEQNNIIMEELSNVSYFQPGNFYTLKDELMSSSGSYFRYSLVTLSTTVLFICLFGIMYEIRRNRLPWRKKADSKSSISGQSEWRTPLNNKE